MAQDDDTIYIDVAARADERSFDEVEGKLRGKLAHVGDSLKDSISGALDSIGDRLGGAGGFGDKLHDMLADSFTGKEWDALGKRAGGALGQGVADALRDVTHGDFGNILGEFKSVGDVLGGALGQLTSKIDGLQKIGGSVGNVLSGNASGQDINDILGGAKGLGLNIPGPINDIGHVSDLVNKLNEHPGAAEDWLSNIPGFGVLSNVLNAPGDFGTYLHNQFVGGQQAGSAPVDWRLEDEFAKAFPTAEIGGIGNAGSMSASMSTQTMDVSAGTVVLGGNITLPGVMSGIPGGAPAGSHASSLGAAGSGGGIPSSPASGGSGLGGAGSFSGLGFDQGGVLPGGSPGYDNMIGMLPGGSMVGLEGGEGVVRPEAMGRPGIADLVSSLNQHYDQGTTGVGGDPNNLTLPTPPTQPNSGGGQGTQQQQLGHGQGAGVSGGGFIGAAEQAGVMAATVAGFGGGGIAAQMAVQETNLAIQKSMQIGAALATAPFETFGLRGGQMGAPTVDPMGGWIGKLVSGELGQQTSLPNLAGSVQPPKQPEQPKPGEDPGNGAPPGGGPTGAKDDPHWVKSADGPPPGPGIGATNSALNGIATMAPLTA